MQEQNFLPETGFLRLSSILALIPIGAISWWLGVRQGRFPKPCKLGPRTTPGRSRILGSLIVKITRVWVNMLVRAIHELYTKNYGGTWIMTSIN